MKKFICLIGLVQTVISSVTPALFSQEYVKKKRYLDISSYTIRTINGIKWAYFVDAIMYHNQYQVVKTGFTNDPA